MLIYRYWTGATRRSARILELFWDHVPSAPSWWARLETGNVKGSHISHPDSTFSPSSGSFWLFGSVTMTSDITFRFHLSIYSFFLMFEQLMQSTLGFHDTKVRLCCRSCDQASSGIFPGLIKNASRSISPRLQILHHISPPEQTTLVYVHYSFCVLPGRH